MLQSRPTQVREQTSDNRGQRSEVKELWSGKTFRCFVRRQFLRRYFCCLAVAVLLADASPRRRQRPLLPSRLRKSRFWRLAAGRCWPRFAVTASSGAGCRESARKGGPRIRVTNCDLFVATNPRKTSS